MNRLRKRIIASFCVAILSITVIGCGIRDKEPKKIEDIEFTISTQEDIPDGLKTIIEEKKEYPFELSYSNKDGLYLAVGYGKQEIGGYSIEVKDLYLTEDFVYLDTDLIGPTEEEAKEINTYPYIVIKMEYIDKDVEFD